MPDLYRIVREIQADRYDRARQRRLARLAGERTRVAVVGVALLALVAAACGTDDPAAEEATLLELLGGADITDPEAMQAQFEAEQREIEEHVAACMAAEGFDYAPREVGVGGVASHPRMEMDEEEFVEQYGYGLSTIDLQDHVVEEPADPIGDQLDTMDQAERDAYLEALHGEMPDVTDEAGPVTEQQPGGCIGEAHEAVRGAQERVWQELGDELDALFERMQSDPRIVEAEAGWTECMREAGWEFTELHEPAQHIFERQAEVGIPGPQAPPVIGEDPTASDDAADVEEPAPPPEPDPDALAELRAEELELAGADFACQVEHFGQDRELFFEVMEDYEREFIDEHRDELDELRGA